MFIEITNPSNPLRTENFLRPYKRGEKEFTPEVARQVLTMTNHPKNIRDTLQLIAEQQNQAEYKEIILSAFDHREQPEETILLGKKLAAANGFENELNAHLTRDYLKENKDCIIYPSANHEEICICTSAKPDFSLFRKGSSLIFTHDTLEFEDIDLSAFKSVKFTPDSKINLTKINDFPAEFDISMCKFIRLTDFDMKNFPSLKINPNSTLLLMRCYNFPENFNFNFNRAEMTLCRLKGVKAVSFKKDAEYIALSHNYDCPPNLDIAHINTIYLIGENLSNMSSQSFANGKKIKLTECSGMSETLDMSKRDEVFVARMDLTNLKSLSFKTDSSVEINTSILPENVDVSMCKKIKLTDTVIDYTKHIKFKNKRQQKESGLYIPNNWQGKITYTDSKFDIALAKLKKAFSH